MQPRIQDKESYSDLCLPNSTFQNIHFYHQDCTLQYKVILIEKRTYRLKHKIILSKEKPPIQAAFLK